MLLGTIINKESRTYIKEKEENGIKKISFDKVDKEGINHLKKKQSVELLNKLFNTKKQYIETKDGYNIYLDENNLKRYYKDEKEDFSMFYLNNGKDATAYLGKGIKTALKAFSFTIGALTTTVMITNEGVDTLQEYSNEEVDKISFTIDTETDYYQPVTLESLKNYIYSSDGLTDSDKDLIYNEDYLSFVLSISDNERKLFDFNDRFKNINIKEYPIEENPGADGYYTYGTNTIHVLDAHKNNDEILKDIKTHEFIHLTQASFKYTYLADALAEIISQEFYDAPNYSYTEVVKRVKVLMEIIGPQPIINAVYSHDTTMFENSIRQYLNEEDSKEFLQLMSFSDWRNPDSTIEEKVHKRVKELLRKMAEKKYEQIHYGYEKDSTGKIIEKILYENVDNRFYFNTKKSEYYKKYELENDYTIFDEYDEDLIESFGQINQVEIQTIDYTLEQFQEMMKKPGFDKFILKFGIIHFRSQQGDIGYFKCNQYDFNDIMNQIESETAIFLDDMRNYLNIIKPNLTEEEIEKDIMARFSLNEIYISEDSVNDKVYITWDDYKNCPYIVKGQCDAIINYSDTFRVRIEKNKIEYFSKEIPSIYEKFGYIYPKQINESIQDEYESGRTK